MVVNVGAEPQAHFIVVKCVTVLLHVASCCSLIIKHCPTLTFETASVLFPPSVTVWILEAAISKVIVAPSVSAVSVLTNQFNVGLVMVLFVSVFAALIVSTTTHSTAITHAEEREIVVSVACPSSMLPTHSAVAVLAVIHATGSHVQFVSVPLDGVPSTGVVKLGDVIVCTPVKVFAASVRATVKFASGRVTVLAAVGQLNVSC